LYDFVLEVKYSMLKLIKNALVYTPDYIGKKDILICGDKIAKVEDYIPTPSEDFYEIEVIDASNQIIVPGFIDLHVHLTGGGGEGGSASNIVDAYDASLTRTTPTVMGYARGYLAAAGVTGCALFGGGYGAAQTNVVDAYDSELTHSEATVLTSARHNLTAAANGNYLLFGGGEASSRTAVVDEYKFA
jgi:formylmethanofuran dehydrogenase subunit A